MFAFLEILQWLYNGHGVGSVEGIFVATAVALC
jgi:hypothetical protein